MVKIPSKLKIGGHLFDVDCSKELSDYGDTSFEKKLIRISSELPQDIKESVLVHEIFHCINPTTNEDVNHLLIASLAEQLYQVLKDNKLIK